MAASAAAVGLASTLTWMFVSSALIIANKRIYDLAFPYPMFVTGVGQLASAAGAAAVMLATGRRQRSLPPLRWMVPTLGPLWAATFLSMWLGNAAYLHLSVAFIQIFKAMTPAFTLLLGLLLGTERLSLALLVGVGLIAAGTGSAAALEAGEPSWSSHGALLFLASSLTEAARCVGTQRLMQAHHFNPLEALLYTSLPAGALLLAGSVATEGVGEVIRLGGRRGVALLAATMAPQWRSWAYAAGLSFVVNAASYWAIQSTGSLTFKVAGCLKNLAVIWYSVAVGHDRGVERVSGGQVGGYLLGVAGFLLYTFAKTRGSGPRASAKAKAA